MVCAKIHKKNEKTKTAELFFEKPSGKNISTVQFPIAVYLQRNRADTVSFLTFRQFCLERY